MGEFRIPVPDGYGYRLTRAYGDTSACYLWNGKLVCPEHDGEDYGNGQLGGPIIAQHDGHIKYIGWLGDKTTEFPRGMGGYCVVVDFGEGFTQSACHMIDGSCPLNVGDHVHIGDRIGSLGATGNVQGGHLHNTFSLNGVPTDPRPYYREGSLPIGDDMRLFPSRYHIFQGKIGPGVNVRQLPTIDAPLARDMDPDNPTDLLLCGWIQYGQGQYNIGGVIGRDWWPVAIGDVVGFVAVPLVYNIFVRPEAKPFLPPLTPPPGVPEEEVKGRVRSAALSVAQAATTKAAEY